MAFCCLNSKRQARHLKPRSLGGNYGKEQGFCSDFVSYALYGGGAGALPPDIHEDGTDLGLHLTVHPWVVIPPSCFRLRGLPPHHRKALQSEDCVKLGGGKFHLRSGFLQTRRGALGIEAVFLSRAGK